MGKMVFIKLYDPSNEIVEGSAIAFSNGVELPDGQLSVRRSKSDIDEVMNVIDMPEHWQEQIKGWNLWAKGHLPCSETMD